MSNTPQVSKCCKGRLVAIHSDEGTGYYVCAKCNKASDPFEPQDEVQETDLSDEFARLLLDFAKSYKVASVCEFVNTQIAAAETRAKVAVLEKMKDQLHVMAHIVGVKRVEAAYVLCDDIDQELATLRGEK